MTIETVYPDIDNIHADLMKILGTKVLQMKAHAQDIAKEDNCNLLEAAEENAKADGIRIAITIIRDLRIEARRTK